MKKSSEQIMRQISDNAKLIHEYELQLARYEGRTCASPRKTQDGILKLKEENDQLRRALKAIRQRERDRKITRYAR
jgi:hypothetical protein